MSDLTPKTDAYLPSPYPDDEIDLKELIMVLWSGKWLISAVTGLAAVISVVVALSLPNIYTASALLAPAESGGGGLSGLMKQYGGLASLGKGPVPSSVCSS
jgi:LPS O-antigen subunit length determinant protein (WzzB/FepE family)